MTNYEPTSAELTERARQLSAEAEHLYSVTRRRKETLLAAKEHALKITGEAASPDGSVRATVDVGGMLTELDLAPDALRTRPGELAQLVTTVTQHAAARARAAVQEVYAPLRSEGIVRDMPILLPEPPTKVVPSTVQRREQLEDEPSYEDRRLYPRRSGDR